MDTCIFLRIYPLCAAQIMGMCRTPRSDSSHVGKTWIFLFGLLIFETSFLVAITIDTRWAPDPVLSGVTTTIYGLING